MEILKPDINKKIEYIKKNNIYIKVLDYGPKSILREIKVFPGQHSWHWVPLTDSKALNISDIGDRVCSFENAINRAVNDPYVTVYSFEDMDEASLMWKKIKYDDKSIKTVYKEEK